MTTPSQGAEVQRRGWGPSNAQVLGPDIEAYPPTMDDLGYMPTGSLTLSEISALTMDRFVGIAWENGKMLSSLRWLRQLDDRLPPPSPQDHGVYLVSAPRGHTRYRFIHWSFYSQGHFYHLTAAHSDVLDYLDAKFDHSSKSSELRQASSVSLKVQNVLDPDSVNFAPLTAATEKTALQAYHVGCTRFTASQLLQIATSVISQIKSYDVFSENCQLFAISMVNRTVMARRNCSVFVGHMHQIAQWDLAGGPGREQGFHAKTTGYVLANPRIESENPRRPSLIELLWVDSWRSIRRNRDAWQIAVLYRDGERALGAYDPEGERRGLQFIWYRFRTDWEKLSLADTSKEVIEDVRKGRWRDACYGRLERRKESYVKKEMKAGKGPRLARLMLPLHRWSRGVTAEERRLWAAEATELLAVEAASGDGGE